MGTLYLQFALSLRYRSRLHSHIHMNIFLRFCLLTCVLLLPFSDACAKGKKTRTIYAFAVGQCFNDSVVYISAVCELPQATLEKKTKFLQNRATYSASFKRYLDALEGKTHIATVFYASEQERLNKQIAKLKRVYARDKSLARVVEVSKNDFHFEQ